jgi:hypothetical protein
VRHAQKLVQIQYISVHLRNRNQSEKFNIKFNYN